MLKRTGLWFTLILLVLGVSIVPAFAQDDVVEIRFMWYSDGVEGEVMRDLLDRFEEQNPDVRVILDEVPYSTIDENLPIQVEAGEGPDMARITNFGGMVGEYLDVRPYLEDPDYFAEVFPEPVLSAMREDPSSDALHGFPEQLSVTAPYINRTLFEQAEIAVPSDSGEPVTWEEWTEVTAQVAEATGVPYAIAIDRTGHRFAGPAMSMGATLINEEGEFTIDTEGFRAFAQLLKSWHDEGLTPREVWLGAGDSYAAAADFFVNGELVMYMSGSWQIGRFAEQIGDAFDWEVVPNPTGEGGSTGIAGGAGIVGFADTEHPEAVARVMEYLIQPEVYGEYSARTLFLPAHAEVAEMGVEYDTELEAVADALAVFTAEIPKLQDQAVALNVHPFAFAYYRNSADRLTQWMVGELSLEEALERLQSDIDEAIADAAS